MKPGDFKLKRIDRYIIRQFLGTFVFALSGIILIVVVFDVNEKFDKFMAPELTLKDVIQNYYLNFIPYFVSMFASLFTFIAVIYFTSKLADRSEIIAMLSTGMSFDRLMLPYGISAAIIAVTMFILCAYVIPPANKKRLDFEYTYIKKNKKVEFASNVQLEVEPGIFAYFDQYRNSSRMGYRFSLERFEGKTLVSRLTANSIKYDTLYNWTIIDYIVRDFDGMYEHISDGTRKDTTLMFVPADFLISEDDCETMTSPELSEYISRQKKRGIGNIQTFEIEYHKRMANAFSFFILTVIGVSLSSCKRKGGMGLNIGVGLGLSFSYILFMTITSSFAVSGLVSPMIASWIPNILYTFIAIYLYRKAPR
ncbi:MAG: LptF/LptG family permease [Tannerella sp.]|jgi:lipopolysaccharide export system permease protein|nr:LptF/LptG family permease [Tannerella sp.]